MDCGQPPEVLDTYHEALASTTYGTQFDLTCIRGMWFYIGVFSQSVACDAVGKWQVTYKTCIGKENNSYLPIVVRFRYRSYITVIKLLLM